MERGGGGGDLQRDRERKRRGVRELERNFENEIMNWKVRSDRMRVGEWSRPFQTLIKSLEQAFFSFCHF